VRPFEILLVADSELVAQSVSAWLRRAGHRVIAATTSAGAVETLMRHGSEVDMILTSTALDSALGEDAVHYGRKFAAQARLIVLREAAGVLEDLELVLTWPALSARTPPGWN
jgi:CheY-like chemotaxis protein